MVGYVRFLGTGQHASVWSIVRIRTAGKVWSIAPSSTPLVMRGEPSTLTKGTASGHEERAKRVVEGDRRRGTRLQGRGHGCRHSEQDRTEASREESDLPSSERLNADRIGPSPVARDSCARFSTAVCPVQLFSANDAAALSR